MSAGIRFGTLRGRPSTSAVWRRLQNVAKHAGASEVTVRLRDAEGWLEFSVVDDGSSFASEGPPQGSGLQNMRDRFSALGGTVAIRSTPDSGTTVEAMVNGLDDRCLHLPVNGTAL